MTLIKKFFALLRRILGYEDDIEKIVKPITRIVDKLAEHAEAQAQKARQAELDAARLRDKSAACQINADKARDLSSKYASLV